MIPPKPASRPDRVSLWRYWRLFRQDILSAQPERLYHAWMAEFRTPFFRSFLVNQPDLVRRVLSGRPEAFPKSGRVTAGLRPLLGASVFVTNGDLWAHQRRIIDPAFEGGRLRDVFPAMVAAARDTGARLEAGVLDIEALASRATADVIFRTLFSIPITKRIAEDTYRAFRIFQRAQPVATLPALIPGLPVVHRKKTRAAARELRRLIGDLVAARTEEIREGRAPDDLATRIMTTPDPETGATFSSDEMVDQVAIFFLAGHETSAAHLGWTLWCLAAAPEWQERVAEELAGFDPEAGLAGLSALKVTRNVLREVLRLYPPVPMMVREAAEGDVFRKRQVPKGAQIVLSPWHLHRHERIWSEPDAFDPARWEDEATRTARREAFIPFSAGPRVCPGAGFAMAEATVLLAALLKEWRFEVMDPPVPVAHLTVRARDGIRLRAVAR
ncbi:cytochrome P450 [Alphaproteobacteria bacterium GH1-50]|uniref:Cytochrome P450 n=1 Tax=Kangsaoukella pontilimi TaxID=2691042 RepID=A0A7C9IQF8_9RHOB|nr:cytochrome P450 [Kangsaoukella pontilimi]MXQ07663.1 cytochrome P450 [Kangsaoukella pontilimi]